MECGKLTAKLRDAVPVCFIEDGREVKRLKNIEIPDALKVLPYETFKFDVPATGAITFKITFAPGTLPKPEDWPQPRERKTRTPKPTPTTEPEDTTEAPAMEALPQEPSEAPTTAAPEEAERAEPENMRIEYNATADYRRDLIKAIGAFLNQPLKYLNAPTFAYSIGEYTVDKHGTLTGPRNDELIAALESQGYKVK